MSQEFTFQIQEFYSKVLWCTYIYGSEDRAMQQCAPKASQGLSLGRASCLLVIYLQSHTEGGFLTQPLSALRKGKKGL